jgi:hypothetical protein
VADNTLRSLCFHDLRMCALIAMSILHRLGLLQKFMILGTIGLMMSALPTYLYVSDHCAPSRQRGMNRWVPCPHWW